MYVAWTVGQPWSDADLNALVDELEPWQPCLRQDDANEGGGLLISVFGEGDNALIAGRAALGQALAALRACDPAGSLAGVQVADDEAAWEFAPDDLTAL